MMLQGLAPSVENHGHAELGAEMLGIGRDGGECLGRRAEQDRGDNGLILDRDLAGRLILTTRLAARNLPKSQPCLFFHTISYYFEERNVNAFGGPTGRIDIPRRSEFHP